MAEKSFKLKKEDIQSLALGQGGCMATDRIVVDGCCVGFMYREEPQFPQDSGWRFFAGDESDTYMEVPEHHGIYDVNTIVNYDRNILGYLSAKAGSEFERQDDGSFCLVSES